MHHMELILPEDKNTWLYKGGYLAPFDLAIVVLVVCVALTLVLWEENYGEEADDKVSNANSDEEDSGVAVSSGRSTNCITDMVRAYQVLIRNRDILLCGIVSSVFEASMYVFVFMWTPAMTTLTDPEKTGNAELPFGLIFSTFMVCCMIGSSLFSIIINKYRPEQILIFVVFIAMACFMSFTFSTSSTLTYVSMCIFEISVGVYFPSMGTMKSAIVPEGQRSAIYNLYRVPLNFIVVLTLVTHLTITQSFAMCVTMLGVGVVLQIELNKRRMGSDPAGRQVQVVTNDEEKEKMVSPDITSV